ncbi:MAG: DUF4147 domain-containing protein [Oscillospiraceae bacterium]|nr:DUF4147 domain-containing protein [Oscillospiraceae bacterium]
MRIQNMQQLTSHGNIIGRKIVAELLDVGLDSLDPYFGVKNLIDFRNNVITIDNPEYEMKGDPRGGKAVYDLADFDRVYVIGAAKGVQRAAVAFEEILGDALTGGHVIAKHGDPIECKKIGVTLAGHPVPDDNCVIGCEKIFELTKDITERDLVFTVTGSGCGSLMTWPAADITLKEITDFTYMMQIEKGVPTGDLNIIRTHIDRFKGGRITRMFLPATIVHMTVADPAKTNTPGVRVGYREMLEKNTFFPQLCADSTYQDAIDRIHKWDAWDRTPESIRNHLLNGNIANENMRFDEYESIGSRFFGLLFKNATVYPTVKKRAKELGYNCFMLSEFMSAEASEAGKVIASIAKNIEVLNQPLEKPVILMTSGELLVTVGDETGIGGRNQEFCLTAAVSIAGSDSIVIGAVDTDGTDGPGGLNLSGAPECLAGAIVDGYTLEIANKRGININDALKRHDTSPPLWELGCGVDAINGVSALDLALILIL